MAAMDPTTLATALATFMLVIVTGILVVVTWQLSKAAERQTDYLRQQTEIQRERQEEARERDRPKVELVQYDRQFTCISAEGTMTNKGFVGFMAFNVGMVDMTIVSGGASFAIADGASDTIPYQPVLPRAVSEWDGTVIENDPVPVRLEPGDFMTVLYDADDLMRIARPFQWACRDSLGNRYTTDHWVSVLQPNFVALMGEPGEGFRPLRVQ